MTDRSRTPDRHSLVLPLDTRREPTFEACGSWPHCDCPNHCEVRRIIGAGKPAYSWDEIGLLGAVAVFGAICLYYGWPAK